MAASTSSRREALRRTPGRGSEVAMSPDPHTALSLVIAASRRPGYDLDADGLRFCEHAPDSMVV
jgi:hypothetical protein